MTSEHSFSPRCFQWMAGVCINLVFQCNYLKPTLGGQPVMVVELAVLDTQICPIFRKPHLICCMLSLPLKTTQKLQLVQNTTVYLWSETGHQEYTLSILKQLFWLPDCVPVQFRGWLWLLKSFMAWDSEGPIYVCMLDIVLAPSGFCLIKGSQLALMRAHNFLVVASTLWNGIPKEMRRLPSLAL